MRNGKSLSAYSSSTNKGKSRGDIMEDEEYFEEGPLNFFVKTKQQNLFTVSIDEPFIAPKYYRNVVAMLMEAAPEDTVMFLVNSPGGLMDGLLTLLDGIAQTVATTVAVLVGQCSSAASMLSLHCDEVEVSDNATMLCHNISYGTGGKGSDVLSHVQHVSKTADKLLRTTYKDFLTETEIDDMISGKEIYLDADEIQERLDNREDARMASQKDTLEALKKQGYDFNPETGLITKVPSPAFEGNPKDCAFPEIKPKIIPKITKNKKV
jgi:ATP-dependent protease ClpP protease subunit